MLIFDEVKTGLSCRGRRRHREVRRGTGYGDDGEGTRRRTAHRRDWVPLTRSWKSSRTARSTRSAPTTGTH